MGLLEDLFKQIGDFIQEKPKKENNDVSISEKVKEIAKEVKSTDGSSNNIGSSLNSSESGSSIANSLTSGETSNSYIQSENIKELVEKKYNLVDSQNKLKGNLFTKLINNANEIIGDANRKKGNTKIKYN